MVGTLVARCFPPEAPNRGRVAVVAALLLFVLAFASPALAWEVSKSSNGVIVTRSGDDTAAVTVLEYYSDKALTGGQTRGQYVYGSQYNNQTSESTIDPQTLTFEWPLYDDDGYHLLVIKRGGSVEEKHVVYREPLRVAVANTSPVAVDVVAPVALEGTATVAIPETITADVRSVGPFDESALGIFGVTLALVGGVVLIGGRARG